MVSASERAREKERRRYDAAVIKELQRAARGTRWKKLDNIVFQQRESLFFAATLVVYLNADKVTWTLEAKPMAVDPVFWTIMDLETNAAAPLSLRARGWFVCDGLPVAESELTPPLPSVSDMATQFLAWAESSAAEFMVRHGDRPFSDLIRQHVHYRARGAYAATLISTLIVEGQRNEAAQVAEEFRSGTRTTVLVHANEGSSFFDRAAAWLAMQTR